MHCFDYIEHFSDCSEYRVVGLDCEWQYRCSRAFGPKIGKVLIVSICTSRGYCGLFRMNKFRKIANCLKVKIFIISSLQFDELIDNDF